MTNVVYSILEAFLRFFVSTRLKAYSFIDSDAHPVICLIIERMDREGRTKLVEGILDYQRKRQLSRVLQRLVKKAGINIGNKEVRFYCLRKFLINSLSSFMSESTSKQIVGARSGVHLFSVKLDVARDFAASINNKNSTEECAIRNERMKSKFTWKNINQVDESTNQEIAQAIKKLSDELLGRFMRSKRYDNRQPKR